MFPSPTHQDPRNAPSHRSFLDARGRTDPDPLIVAERDAYSASKAEPQPPRYTISRLGEQTFAGPHDNGQDAPPFTGPRSSRPVRPMEVYPATPANRISPFPRAAELRALVRRCQPSPVRRL